MAKVVVVLCGGAQTGRKQVGETIRLALAGPNANVNLRLKDISKRMLTGLPPLLTDLIEIAAYVHCADQSVSRGGEARMGLGAEWRRQFRFVVPVRDPARWSSPEVAGALARLLGFLSEDEFHFEFVKFGQPPALQDYLDFAPDSTAAFQADQVALFSGGMDSLAGALEELVNGRRVALVSHSSSPKIQSKQAHLASELKARFPSRVFHVPVLVRRQDIARDAEETQRTRTFLFGALAAVVSHLLGRKRIRLYENGVVSLNLPIAGQVIGAQATRTAHPRSLQGTCAPVDGSVGPGFCSRESVRLEDQNRGSGLPGSFRPRRPRACFREL